MNLIAVLVDELPDTCWKCMFKPNEDIGWIGQVGSYCTLLEKPMAEGGRRPDCPLRLDVPVIPKGTGGIDYLREKYEEGMDA